MIKLCTSLITSIVFFVNIATAKVHDSNRHTMFLPKITSKTCHTEACQDKQFKAYFGNNGPKLKRFFYKFKRALSKGDKLTIAGMVRYPFKTS